MTLWKHYHLPVSVDEAVALLTRYAGQARVVAGGTDLLLELQQGRRSRRGIGRSRLHSDQVGLRIVIPRLPEVRAHGVVLTVGCAAVRPHESRGGMKPTRMGRILP